MANPNVLTNDSFKVLSWLYEKRDKDNLIKVTQQELADDIGLSGPTINIIFGRLKDAGYLIHDDSKVGRYYLTSDAIKVIDTFRKWSKQ